MPNWLLPWLVPLGLAVAVILVAISTTVGGFVLAAVCFVGLIVWRARDVKNHPPAELVQKPFWKF